MHEPLNDELSSDIIDYWFITNKNIKLKQKTGKLLTPSEKFAEVMIDYAGTNDGKYYEKKCDKINN